MAAKKKSYLKKNMNELLDEMDHLGGGINVKLTSQELVCLLPSLHNNFLSQGQSEKEHLKDNKYVLLSSNNQSKSIKKKFKYDEVLHQQEDLMKSLLNERHFLDWFLQGFNLNMIFFGRAINIHNLAIRIISKYQEASENLRVQSVRFSPRSNDNFYTENIEDLFALREIPRVEESGSFFGEQAIKYLEILSSREQLETKIKKISSEVVRITLINGNKASELNLICLYDDLFIHSTHQTKYETAFEKSFLNILSECKAIKYLSSTDSLSRVTFQKTKLLEYLQRTVFGTSKNIIVADCSSVDKPNSSLSKYENLLMRLLCIDKFNEINTVCHRYSSKSNQQSSSDYPSDYNSITHRYSTNRNDDSFDENNDKITKRRSSQSQQGFNRSPINQEVRHNFTKQVSSLSPPQNGNKSVTYDLPRQQQQFDDKKQSKYIKSNIQEESKQKKSFRQEMQDLLSRINPTQKKGEEADDEGNCLDDELQNQYNQQNAIEGQKYVSYENTGRQTNQRNTFNGFENQSINQRYEDSFRQNISQGSNKKRRDQSQNQFNESQDTLPNKTLQTSISQKTLRNSSNYEERRTNQVSKKFQTLQSQQSVQHKQLLDECYQQRIEELNLQIQEIQARYEIELSEQREIIKNQSKKITLLGQENNMTDLILIYEGEIFRYVGMQKKLRDQINYLTDVKIAKDNQNNLNGTQKQNFKFKEMISSLNLELAEREDELAKLRRERRQIEGNSFQQNRFEKRISDLELQRDQLLAKNDDLMNSLQSLNHIIANLKGENASLNKCVSTLTQQNSELLEDNQTLQQILSLSSKESTNKIVQRRVSATSNQIKNQVKGGNDIYEQNGGKFAFTTIEKNIQTLRRLILKTGSGIPEEILTQFQTDLKAEWTKLAKSIEFHKQNNLIVSDFLTNLIASLEQLYGRNDKNVRDMNKFVRNFLLESLGGGEESERQFRQELQSY